MHMDLKKKCEYVNVNIHTIDANIVGLGFGLCCLFHILNYINLLIIIIISNFYICSLFSSMTFLTHNLHNNIVKGPG